MQLCIVLVFGYTEERMSEMNCLSSRLQYMEDARYDIRPWSRDCAAWRSLVQPCAALCRLVKACVELDKRG